MPHNRRTMPPRRVSSILPPVARVSCEGRRRKVWVLATASHAILAPRLRLIPVSGSSLFRVHPGMRSVTATRVAWLCTCPPGLARARYGTRRRLPRTCSGTWVRQRCPAMLLPTLSSSSAQRHMGAWLCYAPPHGVLLCSSAHAPPHPTCSSHAGRSAASAAPAAESGDNTGSACQ